MFDIPPLFFIRGKTLEQLDLQVENFNLQSCGMNFNIMEMLKYFFSFFLVNFDWIFVTRDWFNWFLFLAYIILIDSHRSMRFEII